MPQQGKIDTNNDGRGDKEPDDMFRRLIRNISILTTGEGMNGLLSLAYTVVAVRALGVEGFGFLVLIHIYALLASEVLKFPTWQAIMRMGTQAFVSQRLPELQRLIVLTTIIDVAGGVLSTFVAVTAIVFIGPLIGLPESVLPAAGLYCLSVFFITPSTPLGLLRMWRRVDMLALRTVLGSLARLIGSLVFSDGLVCGDASFFIRFDYCRVARGSPSRRHRSADFLFALLKHCVSRHLEPSLGELF
jgi:O-antigen/teichoic acid export membrane protein